MRSTIWILLVHSACRAFCDLPLGCSSYSAAALSPTPPPPPVLPPLLIPWFRFLNGEDSAAPESNCAKRTALPAACCRHFLLFSYLRLLSPPQRSSQHSEWFNKHKPHPHPRTPNRSRCVRACVGCFKHCATPSQTDALRSRPLQKNHPTIPRAGDTRQHKSWQYTGCWVYCQYTGRVPGYTTTAYSMLKVARVWGHRVGVLVRSADGRIIYLV